VWQRKENGNGDTGDLQEMETNGGSGGAAEGIQVDEEKEKAIELDFPKLGT
jgi:hypothetical protein